MFQNLSSFLDNLRDHDLPPFSLEDLPNFPYAEFQRNQSRYRESEIWYTGKALELEVTTQAGKEVDRYPVRVNPIRNQVHKHAKFLFGEVQQDERPLVYSRVMPMPGNETSRDDAEYAQDVLNRVWWESNGRAIQFENGALAQIYGGCVFKLSWDVLDPMRTIPIRIENPHPKFFVGKPRANDYWDLDEAWIINEILPPDAAVNGVMLDGDQTGFLIEHWTRSQYDVTVNNLPAQRMINGQWIPISGINPWGFVPVVYIPHIRVNGFYGENDIDSVVGVVKELNLRIADFGDAVNIDSHVYLASVNVTGSPQMQHWAPGLNVINLGSSNGITGQEKDPDLFEARKASASESMETLVKLLYDIYRRLSNFPAVADGEDEGSQRSGLTLALRMISMTAHTDIERIFWSTGLNRIARMILRMLQIKGEAGITMAHAALSVRQEWAPVLPRDREMVVQEAVQLMAAKLGSPERLLRLLGVDDTEEEKDLILAFWKELAEMQTEMALKKQEQLAAAGGKNAPPGTDNKTKSDKPTAASTPKPSEEKD